MRNPALSPDRRTQNLIEQVSTAGRVDSQSGIIRNVKILGQVSRNGRTYTSSAMAQAASLYENAKVYLNHPSRDRPHASRSIESWVGVLRNVKLDGQSVRGDLCLIKSHPMSPAILEAALNHSNRFGLSHNADGATVNRDGKTIVEQIHRVNSVDLVDTPATNAGLFESYSGDNNMTQFKTMQRKASSIVSSPRLTDRAKIGQLSALLEMDGMADSSPDKVWSGFRSAVLSVLDDESLSITATIQQIAKLLKSYDKSFGTAPVAKPTTTSEAPPAMGAAEMIESYRGTAGRPYRRSSALVEESRRADRQARIQATIRRYR